MSIRIKLILMTVVLILFAILPLSLFYFDRQEKSILEGIIHQQRITARILAQSTLNIILMNGGDVSTTSVDTKEMIAILAPMQKDGLVYADAILLSSKSRFNGKVLAAIYSDDFNERAMSDGEFISRNTMDRLHSMTEGYGTLTIPEVKGEILEFAAFGVLPDKDPLCVGRTVISREKVLAPLRELRNFVMYTSAVSMFIVSFIGFFFSRFISKPVERLTEAVRYIEKGDYDHKIALSGKDELGLLAETFNNMGNIIKNKIMELELTNRELSKMDKLKDEFLANTSHELRTPIHGIIGIADSLLSGATGELPSEVRHNLQMIVKSGNRLSHLVNDILDYSKLRHADVNLKMTKVDMYSITDVVFSILKPLAQTKMLLLKNRIDQGEFFVYGDENRIQQILFNLVGNAIKFTETGEVTVQASVNAENPHELQVSVSDTGIGIAPERINDIFDSFQQGDGSVSRQYGGTGLGLTITRDLVRLHGGNISVESTPGKGSVFTFTLPVFESGIISRGYGEKSAIPDKSAIVISGADIEDSPNMKVLKMAPSSFSGTILVVDDEEVNLQVMTNYLSLEGFNVEIATGGVEALHYIETNVLPDMLLLDVMMPVMSGYEVCRIIREKYPPYKLPILMLTAKNRTQDIIAGFESGANDYITKPFDKSELLSRVRNLISLKRSIKTYNELTVLKEELSIARKIQQAIIPARLPEIKGLLISAFYEPMSDVGGDFYDFIQVDDDNLGIFIADVTVHGVPAALIGSMLKASFSMSREKSLNPAGLLENINEVMYNHISGRFVSACYSYIDIRNKVLVSSCAAHWPVLIWRNEKSELHEVSSRGRLIGFQSDTRYRNSEFSLHAGDRIFFFTDGLIEERNGDGEIYGEERFRRFITEHHDLEPEMFQKTLIGDLKKWSAQNKEESFEDDITIVIIDILG